LTLNAFIEVNEEFTDNTIKQKYLPSLLDGKTLKRFFDSRTSGRLSIMYTFDTLYEKT